MDTLILPTIFKISLYVLFVLLVWRTAKWQQNKHKHNFTLIQIIVLSILFALLSQLFGGDIMSSTMDRGRYASYYIQERNLEEDSVGLAWFWNICHAYNFSVQTMFFIFSSFCFMCLLLSYNVYKQSLPLFIILILSSRYATFNISILKQGFSESLIVLGLMLYFASLNKNKVSKIVQYIFIAILTYFGIKFHEAGYIIIPIYLCLLFWDNKYIRSIGYVIIVFSIFLFNFIQGFYFSNIGHLSEELEQQSIAYEYNIGIGQSVATVLKSIPYVIITFLGFKYRKKFINVIISYDKLLFMCVLTSFFLIVTVFNYWLFRLAMYTVFPCLIFTAQLRTCLKRYKYSTRAIDISIVLIILLILIYFSQCFIKYGGM